MHQFNLWDSKSLEGHLHSDMFRRQIYHHHQGKREGSHRELGRHCWDTAFVMHTSSDPLNRNAKSCRLLACQAVYFGKHLHNYATSLSRRQQSEPKHDSICKCFLNAKQTHETSKASTDIYRFLDQNTCKQADSYHQRACICLHFHLKLQFTTGLRYL
jgi:hypothetical protein